MTAQLESAQSKAAGADKARKRLQAEVEELTAELDKVISDRGGFDMTCSFTQRLTKHN